MAATPCGEKFWYSNNMRFSLLTLIIAIGFSGQSIAQLGGAAGSFSRMGFGARGMGMGNALSAVASGDVAGYYNPALLSSVEYRHASASFGLLSLDRRLNFLNYTQALPPNAGVSAGIINAGVSAIDGRNSDGDPTGPLKTSENLVYLSFSNRFKGGFSLGVTLKLLYYQLFRDISSTTVGFDFGFYVPIKDVLSIGATVRDVNSYYKFDTSQLYGAGVGTSTSWPFPVLYTIALAYKLPDNFGIAAAELEASDRKTLLARFGVEVLLIPELTVRAGMDRIDLKEQGYGVKPTFGITARKNLETWTPAINYAFVLEPFSPSPMHIVSISAIF